MKSLPKSMSSADILWRHMPAAPEVAPELSSRVAGTRTFKQRGVVLFFTLIALLVMSLAVVALIRSVDTSAMIAGNLAFRQGATTSGDAGVEAAMAWLTAINGANTNINIMNNTPSVHPFNVDTPAAGYYSSLDPNLSLTDPSKPSHINWTDADSVSLGTDSNTGNTVRYVIQRLCRDANQPTQATRCIYGSADDDLTQKNIPYPQDVCLGDGCPKAGQAPMLRVTSRTDGPRNSVSYVQVFVY